MRKRQSHNNAALLRPVIQSDGSGDVHYQRYI